MSLRPAPLGDLSGRSYLVTGANAGLGFFTSARLAAAGAHVILSGRSAERLEAAVRAIRMRVPAASLEVLVIDQASLESVRAGSARLLERERLDGIVANAGLVHTPKTRQLSVDGNELVIATNVLGHFALLAQALPLLERTPGARVVMLGSLATKLVDFRVDDLQLESDYDPWRAYAQSKVAAQILGFELDRRLKAAGRDVASLVAQPGYSISGRTPLVAGVNEPSITSRLVDNLQAVFTQGKHAGAEPTLHALTAADAVGGQYWGPRYWTKGPPALQRPTATSVDRAIAARFWEHAEEYSGVEFRIG